MRKNYIIFRASDLLTLEPLLCSYLSRFFTFSGHTIYFPETALTEPEYISSERILLLPLVLKDKFLGVLRLEGIKAREIKKVFSFTAKISSLILELLSLMHEKKHDARTGLNSEESLFSLMEEKSVEIREFAIDPARSSQPYYKICMGLIVLQWPDGKQIAREFDYDFSEYIFRIMASRLKTAVPDNALIAPMGLYEGRYEYGVLFPSMGRAACHRLAKKLLNELGNLKFVDKFSQKRINPDIYAGHVFYPSDMAGDELRLPVAEQFRRLRERARVASVMARHSGYGRIMPFVKILQRSGRISGNAGNGIYNINLGNKSNVRTGMRFILRDGETNVIKGQMCIEEVKEENSRARIIFLEDAGNLPQEGDKLILMDSPERNIFDTPLENFEQEIEGEFDGLKGWDHSTFIADFKKATSNSKKFALSVARNTGPKNLNLNVFLEGLNSLLNNEDQKALVPELAGRYGNNSFLFLHAGNDAHAAREFAHKLAELGKENNIELAVGIFEWPFINYSKADSESCALKALEYASLLPDPHIGLFNSLAITISADRLAASGDIYEAIEEYKQALLADPENVLALNSLGVCLAGLGKYEDAQRLYANALNLCRENSLKAKICYNMGTLFQKMEDYKNARKFFRSCIKLDSGHFYAGLRLGKLYEKGGHKYSARKLYKNAIEAAGEDMEKRNIAERYLAALDLQETRKSMELLHNILLRNPNDSSALMLLAQAYLLNNEDPATAEILARKSLNIREHSNGWLVLAQALEAQGKGQEAEKARLHIRKDS